MDIGSAASKVLNDFRRSFGRHGFLRLFVREYCLIRGEQDGQLISASTDNVFWPNEGNPDTVSRFCYVLWHSKRRIIAQNIF